MYPRIKALRTHNEEGQLYIVKQPKRATWLHPNMGRHPLYVALCARRKGDGFARL